MASMEEVGEICHQQGQLHVEWKVKDVFSLSKVVDSCYISPTFYLSGHSFHLTMYSNGISTYKSEGWIGLYLQSGETCPAMDVQYTLGFKTNDGEIKPNHTGIHTFAKKDGGHGKCKALERSQLRRVELTPSDVLTITATLKMVPKSEGTADVSVQVDAEDTGTIIKAGCQPTGGEDVLEAIGKLWHSGENSDVIVHVGDVEFKAHRAILGVRTPVLAAMFQHDTVEKTTGVVTINDCEPAIFEEFLHYIYTGAPKELTTENAPALYAVANKYLVGGLKAQCLRFIGDSLCVETFCDAVLLALNYGEAELLELAIKFATKNVREIMTSVQWQRFIQVHPIKGNEILLKALGPVLELKT